MKFLDKKNIKAHYPDDLVKRIEMLQEMAERIGRAK